MCHRFADFRRVPVNHVVRGKYTRPGEVKLARASNRVNDTHPTCNGKDRARCSSLIRRGNDQSAVCSFLAFPFLVQFQFTFVEQIIFFIFLFFFFYFIYFSCHRNLKLWRYYYRREQCPIYLLIVTIPQILFVNCTNFLLFRMLQLIFQSWLAIFVFSMYFPVFLPFVDTKGENFTANLLSRIVSR